MASTKATGTKFEKQCRQILEEAGYLVITSPRTMRCIGPNKWISADNDFFNHFDLCAKEAHTGRTRWIQCKFGDMSNVSRVKKPIGEWCDKYLNKYESAEIWNRQPYKKEIKIFIYDKEKKEWSVKQC